MEYVKDTTGFVRQHYNKDGVCVQQEFRACEPVEYSSPDGIWIDPPENEQYQPFDMVQPDSQEKELDYYVIWMWKCIEPQLYGPYSTPDEQQTEIDRLRTEHGEDDHTFFVMNVTKGAKLEF